MLYEFSKNNSLQLQVRYCIESTLEQITIFYRFSPGWLTSSEIPLVTVNVASFQGTLLYGAKVSI